MKTRRQVCAIVFCLSPLLLHASLEEEDFLILKNAFLFLSVLLYENNLSNMVQNECYGINDRMLYKAKEYELMFFSNYLATQNFMLRHKSCISEISSCVFYCCRLHSARQVRLSPAAVNAEVELLQSFAGNDSAAPLKDINFTSRRFHCFSFAKLFLKI